MGWRSYIFSCAAMFVAACEVSSPAPQPLPPLPSTPSGPSWSASQASAGFRQAVARVEPVAERECRRRTQNVNCDFKIVVDSRRNQPPNAFQSLDSSGRPVITFTSTLIKETRNVEELAFVLSHEAAHHIAGHLSRQQLNAATGALIFAGLATLTGGGSADIEAAQQIGALVGSRTYSKDFELEADQLGTVISYLAGYNPLIGAQYFTRIPDPGNQFLGSHPPNAARLQTVRATMARINPAG